MDSVGVVGSNTSHNSSIAIEDMDTTIIERLVALHCQNSGAPSSPVHKIQNMFVIDALIRSFVLIAGTYVSDRQKQVRKKTQNCLQQESLLNCALLILMNVFIKEIPSQ